MLNETRELNEYRGTLALALVEKMLCTYSTKNENKIDPLHPRCIGCLNDSEEDCYIRNKRINESEGDVAEGIQM